MRDRKRYFKQYYRKHKLLIKARARRWEERQIANGLTSRGRSRIRNYDSSARKLQAKYFKEIGIPIIYVESYMRGEYEAIRTSIVDLFTKAAAMGAARNP